ncbi:MAG: hypothetical protein FWD96_00120 [Defluviitaleaceae bacterium]|nr:hypothetical protein [Defluviitaleaceae bacterium]
MSFLFSSLVVLAVLGALLVYGTQCALWLLRRLGKFVAKKQYTIGVLSVVLCLVLCGVYAWLFFAALARQPNDDESWVMASAGFERTFAVRSDGSLWTWGSNRGTRLGDGTRFGWNRPIKIMEDVSYVYASGSSAMVIKTDDSLWRLGSDGKDQKILENVRSASSHFAITNDGGLWAWGNKHRIGLVVDDPENRVQDTPIKIMDDVAAISAGDWRTMIIRTDDSLWALSSSTAHMDGTTNRLAIPEWIMDDVAYVSTRSSQTVVIKTDGSLWSWSDAIGRREPVKIMDDVAYVLARFNATMAIKKDGSLWAWGRSWSGHLGIGTSGRDAGTSTPVMILENVVAVSMSDIGPRRTADRVHTVAIRGDGSLWAWGNNHRGQLGTGTWISRSSPVRISPATW